MLTLGGRRGPLAFVVLTSGWSGERTLVRLLSAGGTVRCSGRVLGRGVGDPARHLRRVLRHRANGELAHGAVVQPDDLWLVSAVDPTEFILDLQADGIRLITLTRRHHEDRGLPRCLCGPGGETLPRGRQAVDVDRVAVFTEGSQLTLGWLDDVVPGAPRVVFEDDLATGAARAATVRRLATLLGLPAWSPPPEPEPPTAETLWRHVVDLPGLAVAFRSIGLSGPEGVDHG